MSGSNQTSEDEDDSEDESEDDEGPSCCCQGLIQQRKRKVCFEDLEYSNEADFPKKGIRFFFEKGGEVTSAKGFNAEKKPDLGIVTCDVDAVPAGSKLLDKAQVADGGEFEGSMVEELWKKKNSEEAV
ncbi:hypothetical protein Bca4012_087301 [Brassica carinata]